MIMAPSEDARSRRRLLKGNVGANWLRIETRLGDPDAVGAKSTSLHATIRSIGGVRCGGEKMALAGQREAHEFSRASAHVYAA
jgi:hypothetical protein